MGIMQISLYRIQEGREQGEKNRIRRGKNAKGSYGFEENLLKSLSVTGFYFSLIQTLLACGLIKFFIYLFKVSHLEYAIPSLTFKWFRFLFLIFFTAGLRLKFVN